MLHGKTVAVVIPAYQEAQQILKVLAPLPDFVDRIVVVDDCSSDGTSEVVLRYMEDNPSAGVPLVGQRGDPRTSRMLPADVLSPDPEHNRIVLLRNRSNGGVGAAVARGYVWCRDHRLDCVAVMNGDAQMDPQELESICSPVVQEGVDYVKGNRLIHRSAWLVIPKVRYIGNSVLSLLTKIASGYWRISDTQTGYTAISRKALNAIRLENVYKSYGMPNDILVKLNISYCSIREIEIRPLYNVGEQSKMKIIKVIPRISWLLIKSFFKRLYIKYLFRDFHPLFILYHFAFLLIIMDIPILWKLLATTFCGGSYSISLMILFAILTISGFQSLLFAMWMDILDNERLYK